jgi:hypothetical protein
MKRSCLRIIALSFGLLFSVSAWSEDVKKTTVAAESDTSSEVVVIRADVPEAKKSKLSDRNCIRYTGSHISRREKDKCTGAVGRSYDREDIERTGATDIGQALQRLDPSITVRRY